MDRMYIEDRNMISNWRIVNDVTPKSVEDVLCALAANRGMEREALGADLASMPSYMNIRHLDLAADIAAGHIAAGSHITLVGDYDADGITSTAQLSLFLRQIGHEAWAAVIPTREEGYGFPSRAMEAHTRTKLFICMDCGTLDVAPITRAVESGAQVIVIDHHQVPAEGVAPATAMINPRHPQCPSPFKEFCASGLTLLFLSRLRRAIEDRMGKIPLDGQYPALAALGTIADMVPLRYGNRLIAKAGIKAVNNGAGLPLEYLKRASGLDNKEITAGHIAFNLGPRINAAGRMGDPITAFRLLLSEDEAECASLAAELDTCNSARQKEETSILDQLRSRLQKGENANRRALVMGDPQWSPGIIGICASKVIEAFHHGPVLLFHMDDKTGLARGSGRSVPGFDLYEALKKCSDLFIRWGGHKMAAGMTIEASKLHGLAGRMEEIAQGYGPEVFVPKGNVDMILPPELLTCNLYDALRTLEPHGMGNPTPVFIMRNPVIEGQRTFGKNGDHLAFNAAGVPAVWWRAGDRFGEHLYGDIVFGVQWDDYRQAPRMNVIDIAPHPVFHRPSSEK